MTIYENKAPEALQQGDIFRFPLPLAHASPDHKVVRNLYGPEVLEVYDLAELDADDSVPPAYGPDRQWAERVVADAIFTDWFILGSQTCDLDESDHRNPIDSCFVLRIQTVHELFTCTKMGVDGEELSLDEILRKHASDQCAEHQLDVSNPITYGERVRKVATSWAPGKKETDLRQLRNRMHDQFESLRTSQSKFHLPASEAYGIPESFVDLSSPFAILRESLKRLISPKERDVRMATLNPEMTLVFSQSVAGRIARPALDEEQKPDKLVDKK